MSIMKGEQLHLRQAPSIPVILAVVKRLAPLRLANDAQT